MFLNLENFLANLNVDVFGFASGEAAGPEGSPVRGGAEGVGIAGASLQEGPYAGVIGALGTEYGGQQNYFADYKGVEQTYSCHGPRQQSIEMKEFSGGPEIPFLSGYGGGAGQYTAGDEAGYFLFLSGGALGDHAFVGVGIGGSVNGTNYVPSWGGAIF
jgi:hypothetical protein